VTKRHDLNKQHAPVVFFFVTVYQVAAEDEMEADYSLGDFDKGSVAAIVNHGTSSSVLLAVLTRLGAFFVRLGSRYHNGHGPTACERYDLHSKALNCALEPNLNYR
jgi:hypothetical protein